MAREQDRTNRTTIGTSIHAASTLETLATFNIGNILEVHT